MTHTKSEEPLEPVAEKNSPIKKGTVADKVRYLLGHVRTYPIYVIGTGRSGTHWLGYSLKDHPEIRATIEQEPMFGLSTRMALNPALEESLFPRLVRAYKKQLFKSAPRLYLDKSHPNIWLAECLKEAFPEARFIGIERDPYATVASMLKHKGVSAWHARWREFPVPNRFLGITPEMAQYYDTLPLPAQCAFRWRAHHQRMTELQSTLGEDLLVISFETFVQETDRVLATLNQFLGLKSPLRKPEVKTETLHKWENQLSDEALQQIEDTVGFGPTPVTR